MFRPTLLAVAGLACLGLAQTARADHDGWRSDPTVRLGVDVIWGGGYDRHVHRGTWYPQPVYVSYPARHWGPPPGRGWRKHDRHRWDHGPRNRGYWNHDRHDRGHDWGNDRGHRRHRHR